MSDLETRYALLSRRVNELEALVDSIILYEYATIQSELGVTNDGNARERITSRFALDPSTTIDSVIDDFSGITDGIRGLATLSRSGKAELLGRIASIKPVIINMSINSTARVSYLNRLIAQSNVDALGREKALTTEILSVVYGLHGGGCGFTAFRPVEAQVIGFGCISRWELRWYESHSKKDERDESEATFFRVWMLNTPSTGIRVTYHYNPAMDLTTWNTHTPGVECYLQTSDEFQKLADNRCPPIRFSRTDRDGFINKTISSAVYDGIGITPEEDSILTYRVEKKESRIAQKVGIAIMNLAIAAVSAYCGVRLQQFLSLGNGVEEIEAAWLAAIDNANDFWLGRYMSIADPGRARRVFDNFTDRIAELGNTLSAAITPNATTRRMEMQEESEYEDSSGKYFETTSLSVRKEHRQKGNFGYGQNDNGRYRESLYAREHLGLWANKTRLCEEVVTTTPMRTIGAESEGHKRYWKIQTRPWIAPLSEAYPSKSIPGFVDEIVKVTVEPEILDSQGVPIPFNMVCVDGKPFGFYTGSVWVITPTLTKPQAKTSS